MVTLIVALHAETFAKEASNDGSQSELAQLAFTIGVWDTLAYYQFTPNSDRFEGRSVETVSWSANHQFLISDQRGLMPGGWRNKLVITAWNPVEKNYRLVDVDSNGEIVELDMSIERKIRKIVYYRPFAGRQIRTEQTMENISDDEVRFRSESTDEGKTWIFCEGISRKRKPEAR